MIYIAVGFMIFREEVLDFILEIRKERLLSMRLFGLLDLIMFLLFYPVEILIRRHGGRELWNLLAFILCLPIIMAIFTIMIFEKIIKEIGAILSRL
jgi:hypothetical protein